MNDYHDDATARAAFRRAESDIAAGLTIDIDAGMADLFHRIGREQSTTGLRPHRLAVIGPRIAQPRMGTALMQALQGTPLAVRVVTAFAAVVVCFTTFALVAAPGPDRANRAVAQAPPPTAVTSPSTPSPTPTPSPAPDTGTRPAQPPGRPGSSHSPTGPDGKNSAPPNPPLCGSGDFGPAPSPGQPSTPNVTPDARTVGSPEDSHQPSLRPSTAAFPIVVDATQLVYRRFTVPGATLSWLDARTIQTLQLQPGTYGFQVGTKADFTFTVTPSGTVDYEARFTTFLAGKDTATLTVVGFPVTLDARRLSGSGVQLTGLPGQDWITYQHVRMVPASSYRVRQGCAAASFVFTVGLDGTFSYDPKLDFGAGGFLHGNGTTTLEFIGYPLYVDARAAGGTGIAIWPIHQMPLSTTHDVFAHLLPASDLALQISAGRPTRATFSITTNGTLILDDTQARYLQLNKINDLIKLTVLAPLPP
jgi:hypothetical protein